MRPQWQVDQVAELVAQGLNDCQIARATGIPITTVWNWRNGRCRSTNRRGADDCPVCHRASLDEPAYAYLFGLFLGDGCITTGRRGVYRLEIGLDSKYPSIIAECQSAMSAVKGHGLVRVRSYGTWEVVSSHWKHWPCILPHGPGPKHKRTVALAAWQERIVSQQPGLFLRGLIHSDGCRGTNSVRNRVGTSYSYPRYQFTSYSDDIRTLFCGACDSYGVGWRRMNWRTISVARKADVARLDEVIGPKR